MSCVSLLYRNSEEKDTRANLREPSFFADLNLDQVIASVTGQKEEYNLKPFFYHMLKSADAIYYRHRVMQDIEDRELFARIKSFADKMQKVRRYLSMIENLEYKHNKEGWFLEAVETYCDGVISLADALNRSSLYSEAMLNLREYLKNYLSSRYFRKLYEKLENLKKKLKEIEYCILINGGKVTVKKCEVEAEYSAEVEKVFKKFSEKNVKDYTIQILPRVGMNHVEANIAEGIARLYPEVFNELDEYYSNNKDFVDKCIKLFDREVQFYISYLEYIQPMKKRGWMFCYPEVSDKKDGIYARDTFDIALARKQMLNDSDIVCNDFYLEDGERIIVITGPNQGGKTTFARTFGQLHYLASIGYPIPGTDARLFIPDRIFTHFQKEEDIQDLRGRLEDDLLRIKDILKDITPASIVIINEIFSSTTAKDALLLAKNVLSKIIKKDSLAVCVTFLDELSFMDRKVVSMVATVNERDPSIRTYKVIRKAADGLAYAVSIAEKYHLTYKQLKERLKS